MLALIVWFTINLLIPPTVDIPVQTYAVVKEFKSKSSSGMVAVYEYSANGKSYSFWGYENDTFVVGDKIVLVYDSQNPERKEPFYHKPIFLKEEETKKTVGKITRIKWYSKEAVHFEYEASGKLYKRIQLLPDKYKKLFPELTEGKEYQVEYWNKNPQRAIVHLDKPL